MNNTDNRLKPAFKAMTPAQRKMRKTYYEKNILRESGKIGYQSKPSLRFMIPEWEKNLSILESIMKSLNEA